MIALLLICCVVCAAYFMWMVFEVTSMDGACTQNCDQGDSCTCCQKKFQ